MAKQNSTPKSKVTNLADRRKKQAAKKPTSDSPKDQALLLLDQCLELGLRTDNRKAIETAIRVIKSNTKKEINDLDCKRLKYGDKPLKDTLCPGLRLQPQKKGNAWIYRYKLIGENKQKEQHFGSYPKVTLETVRMIWNATQEDLRHGTSPDYSKVIDDLKIDAPAALESELDAEKAQGMTVNELCNKYMVLAGKYKRSWNEDKRQIDLDIKPNWGNMLASDLTHDHVDKLIAEIWDGRIVDGKELKAAPRSAEKLVALGRFMYNLGTGNIPTKKSAIWFQGKGVVSTKRQPWFTTDKNPFAEIELPERESSRCVLKGKTLKNYLRNFDDADFTDDVRNVLKLQLWCNTRISEPAFMDWKEVDLEEGTWTIPASRTKTNAQHEVMLPTQAVELLQSLEPKKKGRVFKFEGINEANVTTNIAEQIRNNRDHLGVPDNFSSHSLRHTGQTLLARLNETEKCPVEVRDRISNHKPGGEMSALYNANDYDEDARIWLQKMADRLDELGGRDAN